MAIKKIGSIYIATEGTFSTDPDADGSDYRYVHAAEIGPDPVFAEALQRAVQNATIAPIGVIAGAQGGGLAFKTEIRGPGAALAAVSAVAASHGEMGLSLLATTGSVALGTGTTFSAGWNTTTGDVASAAGITIGDIIYRLVSAGVYEARRVSNKSTNTLTVAPAWSGSPVAADVCYAMANYKLASSGHGTECIVAKGDGWEYLFKGCMGTFSIELDPRTIPYFSWSYQVDAVDAASAKASLVAATDSWPDPPSVIAAPIYIDGTATPVTNVKIELGAKIVAKSSTEGAQGRSGWVIVDLVPRLTCKAYYAAGNITKYTTEDKFPVFGFLPNGAAGEVFAFSMPNAQLVDNPKMSEQDGQITQDLVIGGLEPTTGAALVVALG